MGNCQTKSATAVADRQQGPPPSCRSDSYSIDLGSGGHSSDASSVDDARLMISKASDEEMFVPAHVEESSSIRANHQPLDALELARSFNANEMEATATATGIEFGFGLVTDGNDIGTSTDKEGHEPAATTNDNIVQINF